MGEINLIFRRGLSYDKVKLKMLTTRLTACGYNFKFNFLEWRNIVTHGQLKENPTGSAGLKRRNNGRNQFNFQKRIIIGVC
jgi:hypothetical protein